MTVRPIVPMSRRRTICAAVAMMLVMVAVMLAAGCVGQNENGNDLDTTGTNDGSGQGNSYDTSTGTCTGKNWTLAVADAEFGSRIDYSLVVFNGRIWIIGGHDDQIGARDDIWYSTNGKDWIQANSSLGFLKPRAGQNAVVFRDKLWIIGGAWGDDHMYGDVWYSDDGIIWTRATPRAEFGPRTQHSSVVFHNRLWIIGGYRTVTSSQPLQDAWYSNDGVSWTQSTQRVAFMPLERQNLLVFDNKIWNIGNGYTSEIWNSANGRDWNLVISPGMVPARNSESAVIYNNKLWIIGGYNSTLGNLADVWYSSDGLDWTQATPNADFLSSKKDYFRSVAVVFDHKIWVIQPYREGNSFKNEVWACVDEPAVSVKTFTTR
jgi:leucine-zipper-like transcriptional regulator 1